LPLTFTQMPGGKQSSCSQDVSSRQNRICTCTTQRKALMHVISKQTSIFHTVIPDDMFILLMQVTHPTTHENGRAAV